MESNNLPKPAYNRNQIILWALKGDDGSVLAGGFGKIVSGSYHRPSENLKSGWEYFVEGSEYGVWESDVTDSYEEI